MNQSITFSEKKPFSLDYILLMKLLKVAFYRCKEGWIPSFIYEGVSKKKKKMFSFEFVIAKGFWYGHVLNTVMKSMPRLWCDRP